MAIGGAILLMDIDGYFRLIIIVHWWLLVVIGAYYIGGYFIISYCWISKLS